MILHLQDAVNVGYRKVIMRTVDTDVVVLAVAATVEIDLYPGALSGFWDFSYIPAQICI